MGEIFKKILSQALKFVVLQVLSFTENYKSSTWMT